MKNYGKVDFATSLAPTSAFPLDGRTVFSTLDEAKAAAASAKEIGSTESRYHYGMKILVAATNKWYKITKSGTLEEEGSGGSGGGGGTSFTTDETLTLENGVLSVNTTDIVEGDNTLPITSAAVDVVVGNIKVLLETI